MMLLYKGGKYYTTHSRISKSKPNRYEKEPLIKRPIKVANIKYGLFFQASYFAF